MSSYSLRRRLLTLLLASVVAAWAVTMLLTYQHAHHELDELLDAHLARSARLLLAQEGDDSATPRWRDVTGASTAAGTSSNAGSCRSPRIMRYGTACSRTTR